MADCGSGAGDPAAPGQETIRAEALAIARSVSIICARLCRPARYRARACLIGRQHIGLTVGEAAGLGAAPLWLKQGGQQRAGEQNRWQE